MPFDNVDEVPIFIPKVSHSLHTKFSFHRSYRPPFLGTDDSTEEIDILDKEVKELEETAAPEKLILPQPEQIAPFNSLSALFPYYTVDPESIVNEELMPILIEDIFLSEDYSGEADYDLLPFYDLDNYDLEFEDSFVVYDATSEDGDAEQEVPSF